MTPIAITGMGMVTAQGAGVAATWAGVLAGRNVLQPWTGAPDLPINHPLLRLKVAQCPELPRPGDLPNRLWQKLSRTQQLACIATDEALFSANLPHNLAQLQSPLRTQNSELRIGLFLATTVCGMDQTERFYTQYRRNTETADVNLMRRLQPFEVADLIARRHSIPASPLTPEVCLTTCVGSAMAIAAAADAIALGECDLALAGGSEALCRVVLSGFNSLKVVAPDGCRPFDKNRPGITVGEGAAILVLESIRHAQSRGAIPLAYLRGIGITCDAHHITAPDPAATQAARAIRDALARSSLNPAQIDYINAHGTGTRDNDAMETTALRAVFAPQTQNSELRTLNSELPPTSSTKRSTGHTFAAAAAIEAILCIQALRQNIIPVNAGSLDPDPALDLPIVRGESLAKSLHTTLSTNFAFGGNNTAMIFTRSPEGTK